MAHDMTCTFVGNQVERAGRDEEGKGFPRAKGGKELKGGGVLEDALSLPYHRFNLYIHVLLILPQVQ